MEPPAPELWHTSEPYLNGIALFNRGEYWEAHEAWEEIWLEADGIQSEFLQGLIQFAAALLKYSKDHTNPAGRLYATATARLNLCPDSYMGLNVREFQAEMEKLFSPILTGPYQPLAYQPKIEVQ